ncbi:P-loop ATPase, Sll1717 family [Brachybacterium paraconglomeratum]|uniref:P-loop ATPase, Sll1717 family n=1 Tax=Brachybacterium paraconglomeratum TaxID=173362 RepID=UPI00387A5D83
MPADLDPTSQSIFFAYAGHPSLRAETAREAVAALRRRGVDAQSWEDLRIGGKTLIDAITSKIDDCDACVAEISSNNPNVLFEAGYALAKGKRVFLALDETDEEALRNWSGLALVDTFGRLNYGGNAQVLATQLFDSLSDPTLSQIDTLLANGKPREDNAILAPAAPHKTTSVERLERSLERKTYLKLLASQDEFGLGTLSYYTQEAYRSSAAILHFMKPSRKRAEQYNAQLALVGGILHGLDRPLLMVAEPEYIPPLDYKDMLYRYESAAALIDHVDQWLSHLPSGPGVKKRLGRIKLDIELPIRTFGSYVAETEKEDLGDYFVQTNEFEAILTGRASVFTGRKGTGKSASMQQAVSDLRSDRRILVVPIKPTSYDLHGLHATLSNFKDAGSREYFLVNLWSYILVTEIALRSLAHAEDLPAGLGADSNTADLLEIVNSLEIDRSSDFTTRLDEAISTSLPNSSTPEGARFDPSEALRTRWQSQLLPKLKPALRSYDRIAVLVDNLDKTWEKGADFGSLSHFLLSLLVTSGKIENVFARSKRGEPSTDVTLTVFLRTDIYDVMTKYAREPDKINPQTIQWRDEELLIRVLEDRYIANRKDSKSDNADALWTEVFCPEVHSLPTRDYILWRALRRPRDIIYLGNAALTTAINRKHESVHPQDFAHAEELYSRFAVDALIVESEAQGFDLEEVIFNFSGLDSTLSDTELRTTLEEVADHPILIDWLIRTSFLGLETRDGSFDFVEGEAEARKKERVAARIADREGREMRYRIHPAFRPYLEIRDDDILNGRQD